MRVLALGGAGGMGRVAVRTALSSDCVDEMVVADLDAAAAEGVAKTGGDRARSLALDVLDEASLGRALRTADVVVNTVGPFYRLGVPILRAAIEAGTHYLDINDDWEPTLEMLGLDSEARTAGVTAVVGMGASPGVSNLLALRAAHELDTVEELVTGWGVTADEEEDPLAEEPSSGGTSAALVHWMHQCSGTIRIWRDGAYADVRPLQKKEIAFPGLGTGTAWTVGHPEAVTLPRSVAGLRESVNVMVMPRWIIEVVRRLAARIDKGKLTAEDAAALLTRPQRTLEKAIGTIERLVHQRAVRLPPLFACARGKKAGRAVRVGAAVMGMPAGGMGGATGVPLALGLRLLAEGGISGAGVFAPEACVDAEAFFEALAPLCAPAFDSREKLVLVTQEEDV